MAERESRIILPKKDKIKLLPPKDLRIEKNGIDRISTPTTSKGLIYEDLCFNRLLNDFPHDYIVGPRLIDYMGDVCQSSLFNHMGRTRPDALVLSTYMNTTYVSAIVECKSGNDPDLRQKANGFEELVEAIDEHPGEIYHSLKISIGQEADKLPIYPTPIYILEDRLRVIFMTNFDVDELRDDYKRLDIAYTTFPMPPKA